MFFTANGRVVINMIYYERGRVYCKLEDLAAWIDIVFFMIFFFLLAFYNLFMFIPICNYCRTMLACIVLMAISHGLIRNG